MRNRTQVLPRTTTAIVLLLFAGLEIGHNMSRWTSSSTPIESVPDRFYRQWLLKYRVAPFECWTDEGYEPSRSDVPRDIQLLCATDYGFEDIINGGFDQFFHNETGAFAPEMVEWCQRAGLVDVADVIREAMQTVSKGEYPRSRAGRHRELDRFPVKGPRKQWDPFQQMDARFEQLLPFSKSRFQDAADRWLRETCGISDLNVPPTKLSPTSVEP